MISNDIWHLTLIISSLRLLGSLEFRQWSASGIQARPIVSSAVQSPSNPLRLQSYSCRHYTTSILFQTKLCIVLHNLCHIWCHSVIAKKRSENPKYILFLCKSNILQYQEDNIKNHEVTKLRRGGLVERIYKVRSDALLPFWKLRTFKVG